MRGTRLVRRFAARTLSGVSAALSLAAKVNEVAAHWLDPDREEPAREEPSAPPRTADTAAPQPTSSHIEDLFAEAAEDVTEVTDRVGDTLRREAPPAPPPSPLPEAAEGRARTAESHIAELAGLNVSALQARIPHLSTDELEELYRYEQLHRNRKTVLSAIERTLAPDSEPL